MTEVFQLTIHPSPLNVFQKEPKVITGFLTEQAARDHFDGPGSRYWILPEITKVPLPDPIPPSDQFYAVVGPDGRVETGSYSYVSPKLYKLADARRVVNSWRYKSKVMSPPRIVPVTLIFGDPV